MEILTGSLFAASLLDALCIQHNLSFVAGLWLLPFLGCCGIMLGTQEKKERGIVWWMSLLWLGAIGLAVFLVMPVPGGAATGWTLAAAPLLAVTATPKYIRTLLVASLTVITIYALSLMGLAVSQAHYTAFSYDSHFNWSLPAWPLVDPNNAACIMVIGFGMALSQCFVYSRRPWLWRLCAGLCFTALCLTESKAGIFAACVTLFIISWCKMDELWSTLCASAVMLIGSVAVPHASWASLAPRLAMWRDSFPLLIMHPWRGIGLGMFHTYYAAVRKETLSGGYFLHNDFYQFAIEMGIPCALTLVALGIAVVKTACVRNVMSGCVLLAVAIMASLEFQLYLQSVSLLVGVALAYHIDRRPYSALESHQ